MCRLRDEQAVTSSAWSRLVVLAITGELVGGVDEAMADEMAWLRPTYGAAFQCIGSRCEDHCCGDWSIPLDKDTYERYKLFPAEKLGGLVEAFVARRGPGVPDAVYAQINAAPTGFCAFFGADKLCAIQKEYGAGLLSATCSIYPRSLSRVEGMLEVSLSLSCPEAARLVLLDSEFADKIAAAGMGEFRQDNVFTPARYGPRPSEKPCEHLLLVRDLMSAMIRDRSRALRERLLLLGALCERLDGAVAEGDVPAMIAEFRGAMESGALRDVVPQVPGDPRLRLELVMKWTSARVQDRATCNTRFSEVFWSFVEGIGSAEGGAACDDVEHFVTAEKLYCDAYFAAYPHVLENYLLNYMFQHLFPFGRAGSDQFRPRTMFEEWLLLATQFIWVEALLIGVAAKYRHGFGAERVVGTVQPFTRAVEHYVEVLDWLLEDVAERNLNSLEGMAKLLRRLN